MKTNSCGGRGGGRQVGFGLAREGEREGIQKGRRDSREERPMILKAKRQTKSEIDNKQRIVCNFNIKFFCPKCPPYNIQKANFKPPYREKYPPN
jgi:hypothetical protein